MMGTVNLSSLSICLSEVSNEIELYVVSDEVKSYVVSSTSNDTLYLQQV